MALVYFAISDGDLTNRPGEFVDVKQILGEEYFTLQSGFLILKKSLDRENQNFIQVAISACDQGRPKKCSTTEINFIVTGIVSILDFRPPRDYRLILFAQNVRLEVRSLEHVV